MALAFFAAGPAASPTRSVKSIAPPTRTVPNWNTLRRLSFGVPSGMDRELSFNAGKFQMRSELRA